MANAVNHHILLVGVDSTGCDDFCKLMLRESEKLETESASVANPATAAGMDARQRRYVFDRACNGKESLELLMQSERENNPRYDFALLDATLQPGWNALETVEHLWNADPKLEIVVCADPAEYPWSGVVKGLAFRDKVLLLKKPFVGNDVRQIVRALTKKQKLSQLAAFKLASLEEFVGKRITRSEASQEEAECLLDAISSLLVGVNASGLITRWNGFATELFRIPVADALGKRFTELDIKWEDPEVLADMVLAKQPRRVSRTEATFTDADGKPRIVGLSAYPIGRGERRNGTLILGADLTQKLVIQQQLQQAQKLEAVGQLAAGVAHEINTPMQYLGDNIDFLKSKLSKVSPLLERYEELLELVQESDRGARLAADLRENLKKVKLKSFLKQIPEALTDSSDGVKHVSRIVRAMKEFSHPGQENKTLLDVNNALESAAAVSTNEWKYVADIEFDLDPAIPRVCAFPGEVSQVFLNIIVNAAHAIGESTGDGVIGKGRITGTTRQADEHVSVSISDTGNGIPEDVQPRIFDPFFTTKEVGRGTGQGLSHAYSVVVQKHGGTITCNSTPGKGTTFLIQLPIDEPSQNPTIGNVESTSDLQTNGSPQCA